MRFAHLLLIYSFYLSVTQRLPAVIVVKLQHLSHITEKHILRMSFQNLLSSCRKNVFGSQAESRHPKRFRMDFACNCKIRNNWSI